MAEREKIWSQVLAILLSCLATFSCGVLFAWPSPSIPILISPEYHLNITLEEASYLTVFPALATVLTTFPCSAFITFVGPKRALLFVALPHLISWALIVWATSIWMLYVSRFINGIADAMIYAALPVYIGEIATPTVRGSWGNGFTFSVYSGITIVNVVGAYMSLDHTAYLFGSVPVLFLVAFYFMPESPYFLLSKGKVTEAGNSLRWLRRKDDVDDELKQISEAIKRQTAESGNFRDLLGRPANRRALLVGIVSRFTQQFCGIAAFEVYCQKLFAEAGGDLSPSTSAIIFSGIMTVVTLVSSAYMDTMGRRMSMQISGWGCTLLLLLMTLYLYFKHLTDALTWFPMAGMIAFIVFFSIGLGVTPNLLLGELFSASVKAKALAVMNVFFGVYTGCSTKIFQLLLSAYGMYASFLFFTICCLVGTTACYFLMPETRGRTLDEIQQELSGRSSKSDKD